MRRRSFHASRNGVPPLPTLRRIVPGRSSRRPRCEARFAAQLQMLQAPGEAAHQRLDVADVVGAMEVAKVGRCERFLAARAVPAATAVVLVRGVVCRIGVGGASIRIAAPTGARRARPVVAARLSQTPSCSVAGNRRRTADRSAAIRRRGRTAAPSGSSAGFRRSRMPTARRRFEHARRIAAADAKPLARRKPAKPVEPGAQRRAGIDRPATARAISMSRRCGRRPRG